MIKTILVLKDSTAVCLKYTRRIVEIKKPVDIRPSVYSRHDNLIVSTHDWPNSLNHLFISILPNPCVLHRIGDPIRPKIYSEGHDEQGGTCRSQPSSGIFTFDS